MLSNYKVTVTQIIYIYAMTEETNEFRK